MAYSYQEYTGDGVTRSFTFTLTGQDSGYLSADDLHVYVNGEAASFTLTSSNTFTLSEAPEAGAVVLLRRIQDPSTPYSDFRNGNQFSATNLNSNILYLLYLLQSVADGFMGDGNTYKLRNEAVFLEDVSIEGDTLTEDLTVNGLLSALGGATFGGEPLKNVGKGEASTDAATVGQLESVAGSLATIIRYAALAETAKDSAVSAAENSGDIEFYDTYSQASSATLGDGQVVHVFVDETRLGREARYRFENGMLVFKTYPNEYGRMSSPISWHSQIIEEDTTVPKNMNAWSFGPVVTIDEGMTVTVSEGSTWTIANGEVH